MTSKAAPMEDISLEDEMEESDGISSWFSCCGGEGHRREDRVGKNPKESPDTKIREIFNTWTTNSKDWSTRTEKRAITLVKGPVAQFLKSKDGECYGSKKGNECLLLCEFIVNVLE
jgi:hypothetical protein